MIRTKHNVQLNLIRKVAWSFHNTTGIDFQELFAEASLAYCEVLKYYNPVESKLTTYQWGAMEKILIDRVRTFVKKQYFNVNLNGVLSEGISFQPSLEDPVKVVVKAWPRDLRIISRIVLHSNIDYGMMKPKMARGHIYRTLRDMGWTWQRIWKGFREIKKTLNETEFSCII